MCDGDNLELGSGIRRSVGSPHRNPFVCGYPKEFSVPDESQQQSGVAVLSVWIESPVDDLGLDEVLNLRLPANCWFGAAKRCQDLAVGGFSGTDSPT
jgi:hypothetical protein